MENFFNTTQNASEFASVVSELVTLNDENLAERVMQTNDVQNALLMLDQQLNSGKMKRPDEACAVVTLDFDNVYEKVFLNVPIIDFLRHRADILCIDYLFDCYDVDRIRQQAVSHYDTDKCFIWLCRKLGTNYCSERETFIRDTTSFKILDSCAKSGTGAYAVLVEITGIEDNEPIGNVYMLNLMEYVREIQYSAVWQKAHKVTYQDGHTQIFSLDSKISWYMDHGPAIFDEPIPESEAALAQILRSHKARRQSCVEKAMKEAQTHG